MKFKLNQKEDDALRRLYHGESGNDFKLFLGAIGRNAATLNESLIYGSNKEELSLEVRQGMTRASVELIKAIEASIKVNIK